MTDDTCIDCDRPLEDCTCEDVLRCSCGIPDAVCVCAGESPRTFTDAEWAEVLRRPRLLPTQKEPE